MPDERKPSQRKKPWWPWVLYILVGLPTAVSLVGAGGYIGWAGFKAHPWSEVGDPLDVPDLRLLIEAGVPENVISTYETCARFKLGVTGKPESRPVPPDCSLIPIVLEEGWKGWIGMQTIKPLQGLWTGEDPVLVITSPYEAELACETHTDEWDRFGSGLSLEASERIAWITVEVPPQLPETLHSLILAQAGLTITAPYSSGRGYRNKTWETTRELQFFVVTAGEMTTLNKYFAKIPLSDFLAAGVAGIFLVLSGLAIVALPPLVL